MIFIRERRWLPEDYSVDSAIEFAYLASARLPGISELVSAGAIQPEPSEIMLAKILVELAKKEVGVEEVDGTNCGPRVNEYKAATTLPPTKPWKWCAAFICWLVREAMAKQGGTFTFKRPTTAGAWDFENWSKKQDDSTQTKKPHEGDIKAGDIVVFTFSHIGLAISAPDADGIVTTIEGNTDQAGSNEGGGVYKKKRPLSKIRSRIRFTV